MLSDEQISEKEMDVNVLIIEDENMMSGLISDILSPFYSISVAKTVREALKASFDERPNLILCDIKLPDGSGLEIIKKLKQDEMTAHIPILVISCLGTEEDIIKGLKIGADDYISKPFSNKEVLYRIKTQLKNRHRTINWCNQQNSATQNAFSRGLATKEQQFVERLRQISETLIKKGELSIDTLAREMAQSKRQLQRKVKEHLDCSCSAYMFDIRMDYATVLSQKGYKSKEITSMVGYKDVSHFSRIFKKYQEENESGYDA